MNLAESNEYVAFQEKKAKKKKMILFLITLFIPACLVLLFFIFVLSKKRENTEKLFVNNEKANLTSTIFIKQNGKDYVSVKEMAQIINSNYVKGEYKSYTQDVEHCYIENKYEVVSFSKDSKYIKKYLQNNSSNTLEQENKNPEAQVQEINFVVNSPNDTMELLELSSDVILVNDLLYVPLEDIEKVFNVDFILNKKDYNIYTLDYLFKNYANFATNNLGVSISNIYENVRALTDGIIIGSKENKFGVVTSNKEEKISYQFSKIVYSQNTNEYFVYTNDTVGLVDEKGVTIIKPTKYDSLSIFDEKNKLYLAESNGKYGVLDRNNDMIVPISYSAVGIKVLNSYEDFSDIFFTDTPNLLESKYIMVSDDSMFGLFDLDGNQILRPVYDAFGYLATSNDKKNQIQSTLIVPKEAGIYGIIVKQGGKYGIYDFEAKDLSKIPCSLSKIYSKLEGKKNVYYMELGKDEIINIREYIEENFGIEEEEEDEEVIEEIEEDDDDDEIEEVEEIEDEEAEEDEEQEEEEIIEDEDDDELIEEEEE